MFLKKKSSSIRKQTLYESQEVLRYTVLWAMSVSGSQTPRFLKRAALTGMQ